jgi:hypothetical protein
MRGKAIIFMTLLAVLMATASFAACPEVTIIGALYGGEKFKPLRIAVGPNGNTYVTDAKNDTVYLYNYAGTQIKSIKVETPLGIAVDDAGNVYVGSGKGRGGAYSGKVTVYDSGLNPTGAVLGSGFKYPVGIATDADWVYVADSRANSVSIYNAADGSPPFGFGGRGTAAGNLANPDNVYVHPTIANTIIVADRALVLSSSVPCDDAAVEDPLAVCQVDTKYAAGAGVHEFEVTYDGTGIVNGVTFVKKYANYGFTDAAGVISLIGGMVVDSEGRVIVSEYNKGVLHVFSPDGTSCIVQYDSSNGSQPQGLAVTADGRLFVGDSGRVIELGFDAYTKMAVTPAELAFSAQECGDQPDAQFVTVSNAGPGDMSFTVSSNVTWLTPSPTTGNITTDGDPVDIEVQADKDGLPQGTSTGTLTVSTAAGSVQVPVALEVLPPSELSVSPTSLSFNLTDGSTASTQTLNMDLTGSGDWSASSDSAWLGISPASGTSGSIIMAQVSVDAASLASGQYIGNITVNADCMNGSPVVVPVTLDYVTGGTIGVTTNIDAASFSITGPVTYSGTGKTYTANNVPSGTYTIEFDDVQGFLTPDSYSLDMASGGTISFNGDYTDIRASLNILVSTGNATGNDPNELKIYDGGGALLDSITLRDQASSTYFWNNSIPASGDVDGDGVEELIISHDVGVITGLEADGSPIDGAGLDCMPFADRAYVDVAVADLDGDGVDEIVVSALNWSAAGAAVRVFSYAGGTLADTGVNFLAYTGDDWVWSNSNDRRGTKVATGDMDGDGMAEILTVQGGGYSMHKVYARMFKVNTSGGPGNWSVSSVGEIRVSDIDSYYSDIAAGDLDADGVDEIIISDAPALTALAQDVRVMAFSAAGDKLVDFAVNSVRGVEVAAGDLDYDGVAEIVVGEGAFREGNSSRVRVFDAGGTPVADFMAFDADVSGVRISVGQPGN